MDDNALRWELRTVGRKASPGKSTSLVKSVNLKCNWSCFFCQNNWPLGWLGFKHVTLNWATIFCISFKYILYRYSARMYVYTHVHLVPAETRKRCQIPQDWNYRQVWARTQMTVVERESSWRPASERLSMQSNLPSLLWSSSTPVLHPQRFWPFPQSLSPGICRS